MSSRHLLIAFILVGCATELELGETQQGIKASPGDDSGGCPTWGCGSNSPVIDAIEFFDLHERGRYNAAGYRIERFEKYSAGAWRTYRADVLNGELLARNTLTGAIVFEGGALLGARFVITNRQGQTFHLGVLQVGATNFWAQNPVLPIVPITRTYLLGWKYPTEPDKLYREICGAPSDEDGIDDFFAVLFDDDRIDDDAIRVTGETADWFNIGCAGHALAKQHLTGHTKAASVKLQITTTIAQRTANLKMISADYCGGGDPFTVAGQPLRWKDDQGWFASSTGGALEARWTENGAACLNTPRVDANRTAKNMVSFPDGVEPLLQPSAGWCVTRPPPCTGTYYDTNMQGAHLASATLPMIGP